jgi:hypothetical protein
LGEIGVRGSGLFSAYYAPWRLREQIPSTAGSSPATSGFWTEGARSSRRAEKGRHPGRRLKFFPEEVEDCINQFPGIKESRVFSRPHARMGEVPCAEVAVEPDATSTG